MLLSASRRTDLPAFYTPWLMSRLRTGSVLVRSPRSTNRFTRMVFSPETVDCIVFWTKNPTPMLPHLEELDRMGWRYYFQVTLTPYGPDVEPYLPEKREVISAFRSLAERIGPRKLIWRYDPVILNGAYSMEWHIRAFAEMADRLKDCFRSCTISFVDLYRKLSPLRGSGLLRELTREEIAVLCREFHRIGLERGFNVNACCETEELSAYGIHPASCVNACMAEEICGYPLTLRAGQGLRKNCGCAESFDIGGYDTCLHGCRYCYATNGERAELIRAAALHCPASELLSGEVPAGALLTEKTARSNRAAEPEQFTLYRMEEIV